MKTLKDKRYIDKKGYKCMVFEIFLYCHIVCVCAIPIYRVYQLYDIYRNTPETCSQEVYCFLMQ